MTPYTDWVSDTVEWMTSRAVTLRRYGANGEYVRPMIHRWPKSKVRGSVTFLEYSISAHNRLLKRLFPGPKAFKVEVRPASNSGASLSSAP